MKIFYTSDVHGSYFPTDYMDRKEKNCGLFSTINGIKADIFIDGGDSLQGNALSYYLAKNKDFKKHGEIFSELGYDYIALGNHDFNFGYFGLKEFLSTAPKALCANLVDERGELDVLSYDIVEFEGEKYGLTSVVTDWVNIWDKNNLAGLKILDAFESAKKIYDKISDCDYKILIYHGGYERDLENNELLEKSGENCGCKIIDELDYDLVLTAHQHMDISGFERNKTYSLQNPPNSQSASLIEIGNGIKSEKVFAHQVKSIEKFDKLNEVVQDFLDEPIASLTRDYLPADKLQMAMEGSDLADLINKILLKYFDADLSILSFANEITGFHKNLTIRDILNTYKFTNNIQLVKIDGKTLKDALNKNYEYVLYEDDKFKINPRYLKPKIEHYNFDFFYGIDFCPDFKDDIRVKEIYKDNKLLKDTDELRLLITDYRKSGAGGFPMYRDLEVLERSDRDVIEILIEYFSNLKA